MIQPISLTNINFKGQIRPVSSPDAIEEAISYIGQEEEQAMYQEALDTFVKNIEEDTPDNFEFAYDVTCAPWDVHGSSYSRGDQLTFRVYDLNKSSETPVYKNILPVTDDGGRLWLSGKGFKREVESFFQGAFKKVRGQCLRAMSGKNRNR